MVTGLPEVIAVSSNEIFEAMKEPLSHIAAAVTKTLEKCPPELSGDIIDRGIVLTGGGALLKGMDALISEETNTPVFVADSALDCVAIGTGKALDNIRVLQTLKAEKR